MNKLVKAVFDLMESLGVSLDDLIASKKTENASTTANKTSATTEAPPESGICFSHTKNGMEYAKYKGKVLGLVFSTGGNRRFIFSLKNEPDNVVYEEACRLASNKEKIDGKSWCVPYDEHFIAVKRYDIDMVNGALRELGGTLFGNVPYLSATSQKNKPNFWAVRLILPL